MVEMFTIKCKTMRLNDGSLNLLQKVRAWHSMSLVGSIIVLFMVLRVWLHTATEPFAVLTTVFVIMIVSLLFFTTEVCL